MSSSILAEWDSFNCRWRYRSRILRFFTECCHLGFLHPSVPNCLSGLAIFFPLTRHIFVLTEKQTNDLSIGMQQKKLPLPGGRPWRRTSRRVPAADPSLRPRWPRSEDRPPRRRRSTKTRFLAARSGNLKTSVSATKFMEGEVLNNQS